MDILSKLAVDGIPCKAHHRSTSPSIYIQVIGTAEVHDSCGTQTATLTNATVAVAPEHMSVSRIHLAVLCDCMLTTADYFLRDDTGTAISWPANISSPHKATCTPGSCLSDLGSGNTVGNRWVGLPRHQIPNVLLANLLNQASI
jgi:hypothetical protein